MNNQKQNRIVLIMGGGDWYDASVDDLIVPADMDLDEQKKNWDDWYRNHYVPKLRAAGFVDKKKPESFVDWLIERGCRKAELEQFYD